MTLQSKRKKMKNGFHQVLEITFNHFTLPHSEKMLFCMNIHRILGLQLEDSAKNQLDVNLDQDNICPKTSNKRLMKNIYLKKHVILNLKNGQI